MELFKDSNIDFLKYRRSTFAVSVILIILGVYFIFFGNGPNWGIDFTGGSLVQLGFSQPVTSSEIRDALSKHGMGSSLFQTFSRSNEVIIRVQEEKEDPIKISNELVRIFSEEMPDQEIEVSRNEMVGPLVGEYLKKQAILAFSLAFLGIILYVGWRFKGGIWGLAGVIALIHDVFITFSVLVLMGKEITLIVVVALLLLAGYSINDTIVIYDRIRENMRIFYKKPLYETFNLSINGTLSRTVITSSTTLFVVLSLFFFGGEVIHDFSFALIIGIIIGTYSSVFIASPIVFQWKKGK